MTGVQTCALPIWEPETMFREGIRRTIQWFFEHEEWMKNVTSGDYQKYYTEMYEK